MSDIICLSIHSTNKFSASGTVWTLGYPGKTADTAAAEMGLVFQWGREAGMSGTLRESKHAVKKTETEAGARGLLTARWSGRAFLRKSPVS